MGHASRITRLSLLDVALPIIALVFTLAGTASPLASSAKSSAQSPTPSTGQSAAKSPAEWPPYQRELTRVERAWIDQTLLRMTLDEKLGQMVAADTNAIYMSRDSESYTKLVHQIVDNKVGTLTLFRSDVWATAILTNRLQRMAKIPLLVSADLEMGPGMRLDNTEWWAPNMAVAATGDPAWARKQGSVTAFQARAIGINWLYAPVADVNNNADNPVINTRSYGEDPETVSKFVTAFVDGAQSRGSLATAKHFPGHGDTAIDSHIGLPVVDVDRARLDQIELIPFRRAIQQGVGAVMSAHIALPRIDPEIARPVRAMNQKERDAAEFLSLTESESLKITLPSTLSRKVITELLRDELGFKGIITTDAMSMAGIASRYDPGTAAVLAVKAGVDIVLKSPDVDAAISALRNAVKANEITIARIDASVRRVLEAKARLSLNSRREVPLELVDRYVSSSEARTVAQDIADKSITLVRDDSRLIPLSESAQKRILNLTITDEDDRNVMMPLSNEFKSRGIPVYNAIVDQRTRDSEVDDILKSAGLDNASLVVVSLAVRARSGKGALGLNEAARAALMQVKASGRPLVAITFGSPYLLKAFDGIGTCLAAYSAFPVSQRAALRALIGEIAIGGKLPVTIPDLFPRGHGLRVEKK